MKTAALLLSLCLFSASTAVAADPPAGAADTAPPRKAEVAKPSAPAVERAPSAPAAAASPSAEKAMADVKRIRERATQIDPKEKEVAERSLRDTAVEVDAASAKKEKVEVAGRLAAEFGGIPELYIGERERLKTGWGELAIAHTILANAETAVTIDQLYDLRQEGLGWGQIAHGLDMNLGEFTKMANAKSRATVGAPGAPKSDLTEAKAETPSKEKPAAKGKAKK